MHTLPGCCGGNGPVIGGPVGEHLLPQTLRNVCARRCIPLSRDVLTVLVLKQRMSHFRRINSGPVPAYGLLGNWRVSTSRFGTGQAEGSHQTPLGLHRIAAKIGGGQPPGTVFQGRKPAGLTWRGCPGAAITHRILWLEGLEPGWNRGGTVDSRHRFIYIHGTGDELTLGRPASRGCIHLAGTDLIPLFDRVACGALVWIE